MLHGSVLGDVFDVLTDQCGEEVLRRYPRLMTLGAIRLGRTFFRGLQSYVRLGGQLLVNAAHVTQESLTEEVFGAKAYDWSPGRKSGSVLSLLNVKPIGARVLVTDDDKKPLVLENSLGSGKILLVTVRHNLTGERPDKDSQYVGNLVDFLKSWIAPVYPLGIQTVEGSQPQFALNRLGGGWLVIIGNHAADPWAGRICLTTDGATSVMEVWTQTRVNYQTTGGKVTFDAEAPRYSFRIFQVLQ